ncbi:MAG: helix-turn-helix transcriptional regulator [Pseudomonas sp.]
MTKNQLPVLLLDERDAAAMLGLTPRTLQSWRASGAPNLPYVKVSSRCVRYRLEDLQRWVAEHVRSSTTDQCSCP